MAIYRDYENPYALQDRREFLIEKRDHLRLFGKLSEQEELDIAMEIAELSDRIKTKSAKSFCATITLRKILPGWI